MDQRVCGTPARARRQSPRINDQRVIKAREQGWDTPRLTSNVLEIHVIQGQAPRHLSNEPRNPPLLAGELPIVKHTSYPDTHPGFQRLKANPADADKVAIPS
jgi:hypothetical protein